MFKKFDQLSFEGFSSLSSNPEQLTSQPVHSIHDDITAGVPPSSFSSSSRVLNSLENNTKPNSDWRPTQEWFQEWKEKSPTQTVMCLIHALLPLINAACAQEELPDQQTILQLLKKHTLVGVLPVPPPILIRNYVPHSSTDSWLTLLIWRVIVAKRPSSFFYDNLRLFKTQDPTA